MWKPMAMIVGIMLVIGIATCATKHHLAIAPEAMQPPDAEFELPGDPEYELIRENKIRAAQGLSPLTHVQDRERPPAPFPPEP